MPGPRDDATRRWSRRVVDWTWMDHLDEACDLLEQAHEQTGSAQRPRRRDQVTEAMAHTAVARAKMLGRIRA